MTRPTLTCHPAALLILRTTLGVLFGAHGGIRIAAATVGDFGEFLGAQGFPLSLALAWSITVFELVGATALIAGRAQRWFASGFIVHQLFGIVLVHAAQGWFVVGYANGGVEYSILLIAALLTLAWPGDSARRH